MKKIKGILWSLSSFALISGVIFQSSCKTAPTKGENLKGKLEQKSVQNLSPKQVAVNTICHDFSSNMAKCYAHGQTNGNCDNVSEEINGLLDKVKQTTPDDKIKNEKTKKLVQYCNYMCKKGINAKTAKEEIEDKLFSICKEKLSKK